MAVLLVPNGDWDAQFVSRAERQIIYSREIGKFGGGEKKEVGSAKHFMGVLTHIRPPGFEGIKRAGGKLAEYFEIQRNNFP